MRIGIIYVSGIIENWLIDYKRPAYTICTMMKYGQPVYGDTKTQNASCTETK